MDMHKDTHKSGALERANALAQVPVVQVVQDLKGLGLHIQARRKKLGVRVDDAMALSGVSADVLSQLEHGAINIGAEQLLAVLDSLGLALVLAPKDHELLQRLPQSKVFKKSAD